jgi:hypothetical protein
MLKIGKECLCDPCVVAAARKDRDDLALTPDVHSAIRNISFSRFQSGEQILVIHLQTLPQIACAGHIPTVAYDEAGCVTHSPLHSGDD